MYAVIMAGGSGTRLWPMSRESKPKQLHKLISDKTLLQETYERLSKAVPLDKIYISAIPKFVDEIKSQLPNVPIENYIIEPCPKNTTPAFAYIATKLLEKDPDATIATIASDHMIRNTDAFIETVKTCQKVIEKYPDHLVAVGINPDFPSTELGYMRIGSEKCRVDNRQVFNIEQFTEKPDLETAKGYVRSWSHLWNGAYYFFKAEQILKWIEQYRPKVIEVVNEIHEIEKNDKSIVAESRIKALYNTLDKEQIENAIVEDSKFNKFLAVPADLGWSDIGTWQTLSDVLLDNYSTHIISRGNHVDIGSKDSLVYANEKLVATMGLENIIVIDTDDVLFIADKTKANNVKDLLSKLRDDGKHLYL
jgi:mannose-1-phosphate guanylyltransferase